jgi:hypothetical protein
VISLEGINWLAVVVAAVVFFGLGALWYGPLFGKMWAAAMGYNTEDGSLKMEPSQMAITALMCLIMVVGVAWVLRATSTVSVESALWRTFLMWAGFTAAGAALSQVWSGRPWTVWMVNVGYQLVGLLIAAVILWYWR